MVMYLTAALTLPYVVTVTIAGIRPVKCAVVTSTQPTSLYPPTRPDKTSSELPQWHEPRYQAPLGCVPQGCLLLLLTRTLNYSLLTLTLSSSPDRHSKTYLTLTLCLTLTLPLNLTLP